jgi:hypothetical protein
LFVQICYSNSKLENEYRNLERSKKQKNNKRKGSNTGGLKLPPLSPFPFPPDQPIPSPLSFSPSQVTYVWDPNPAPQPHNLARVLALTGTWVPQIDLSRETAYHRLVGPQVVLQPPNAELATSTSQTEILQIRLVGSSVILASPCPGP